MKAKGLDHIAIAVNDLEGAIAHYRDVLGLQLEHVEEVPDQEVRVAIFGKGMGRIELICPTRKDSGVGKFLQKRGEGLHHICVEVEDLTAALAELRRRGAPLIDGTPRMGAGGAQIAFVHPKGARGVLTELRQGPKED
ncbi:MAG: methylmalonyl-CoA epimerase [Myxococcaceae bacterium]